MTTIVIHRVNDSETLEKIPREYGIELDVRDYGKELVLGHEPFILWEQKRGRLEDYLKNFNHALAIFDVKSEFIEKRVLEAAEKAGVKNFFLLGITVPATWALEKAHEKRIAIRFSEDEPIESALKWAGRADWVWVDTKTKNPLTRESFKKLRLSGFKVCLVSPCRWGRPQEIEGYVNYFKKNGIKLDAVMTERKHAEKWAALDE